MDYTVTEGNYIKFGVQWEKTGYVFTFAAKREDQCAILLYSTPFHIERKIEVPAEYCVGEVRSVFLRCAKRKDLYYNFEINGEVVTDPYARAIAGRECWNDTKRCKDDYAVCGRFEDGKYHWKTNGKPELTRGEMIMYKLHVRGFSMDGNSGNKKGTFAAVEAKIPYLKELGITTIELMPVYEFEEMIFPKKQTLPEYVNISQKECEKEDALGLNYWGYTDGSYFASKASYSRNGHAAQELKHLIDTLHANNMECVMEMYFEEHVNQNLILEALRYWTMEYRVDGFHLIGEQVPILAVAQDSYLKRTKIFYHYMPELLWNEKENYPHLFVYNDEYLYAGRKILNRQGGSLYEFSNQQRKQNETIGFVNYLTNNNGFTLADLFSYCEKHNEDNGEENADGTNYNFSTNCGAEGKTTRKYVKELRKKHMFLAFSMLLTGQGVPLFMAGDEVWNSQNGNNNAYCQDNKTGWVNWRCTDKSLLKFVHDLILFRREHPIICSEKPMRLSDFLHKGCPDMSYHSENAWISAFPEEKTAFGVMYNGNYTTNQEEGDFVYIGYNFHTGKNMLALPKLPGRKKWYYVMDTAGQKSGFLEKEIIAADQHGIEIAPMSVMLLTGK